MRWLVISWFLVQRCGIHAGFGYRERKVPVRVELTQ